MNEFGEKMEWPIEIVLVFVGLAVIYEVVRLLLHGWHRSDRPTESNKHEIPSGDTMV